jgi:hypothetical protein
MTIPPTVLSSESEEVCHAAESASPVGRKVWEYAVGAAAQLLPTHLGEQVSVLALVPLSSILPRWCVRMFASRTVPIAATSPRNLTMGIQPNVFQTNHYLSDLSNDSLYMLGAGSENLDLSRLR